MKPPEITIFVRHAKGCKYADDELATTCNCRKHLRWSIAGKQYRKQAGSRSWSEAVKAKRALLEHLTGDPGEKPKDAPTTIAAAIKTFLAFKSAEGLDRHVQAAY
jgi:hypothetical protein